MKYVEYEQMMNNVGKTLAEEIVIFILCIFIFVVVTWFDIYIQLAKDGWYIPTLFTWFGIFFLFIGYAFGKGEKKRSAKRGIKNERKR